MRSADMVANYCLDPIIFPLIGSYPATTTPRRGVGQRARHANQQTIQDREDPASENSRKEDQTASGRSQDETAIIRRDPRGPQAPVGRDLRSQGRGAGTLLE